MVRGAGGVHCRRPVPRRCSSVWPSGKRGKACRVVVPDDQLSLAIGKEGQNARLAAKLTGWKIDIKPASAPADEEPEDEADVLLDDEAETEE